MMVHKGMSSSYRLVNFNPAWFSSLSLSSNCLCVFGLHGAIYAVIFFYLHPFLYLLVSWAWWDWPLTWLTNHCRLVLRRCWLGHLTRKVVPEMTYNVSSGTLNPTIPCRTLSVQNSVPFAVKTRSNSLMSTCAISRQVVTRPVALCAIWWWSA